MCFSLFGSLFLLPSHLLFRKEPRDREAGWKTKWVVVVWDAIFPPYAWVPGVWHVLYIFLVPTSLNKYNLMYSSQEMKFYTTDLCLPQWVHSARFARPSVSPSPSASPSSSTPKWAGVLWFLVTICMVTTNFITFRWTEFLCSPWMLYFKKTALDFLNYS